MDKETYIYYLKKAGQSIIDNAEEIINMGTLTDNVTQIDINIQLDGYPALPLITLNNSYFVFDKEIESKMENGELK